VAACCAPWCGSPLLLAAAPSGTFSPTSAVFTVSHLPIPAFLPELCPTPTYGHPCRVVHTFITLLCPSTPCFMPASDHSQSPCLPTSKRRLLASVQMGTPLSHNKWLYLQLTEAQSVMGRRGHGHVRVGGEGWVHSGGMASSY
jgi:hypothetical protein